MSVKRIHHAAEMPVFLSGLTTMTLMQKVVMNIARHYTQHDVCVLQFADGPVITIDFSRDSNMYEY